MQAGLLMLFLFDTNSVLTENEKNNHYFASIGDCSTADDWL